MTEGAGRNDGGGGREGRRGGRIGSVIFLAGFSGGGWIQGT